MTEPTQEPASYHVLLVGIDSYAKRPLRGCVNDIDAVQALLLERVGVPKERILRLASPQKDAPCSTEIAAKPATLANLLAAFAALCERATAGDRVFIYYSGHGSRLAFARPSKHTFHREALVPADVDQGPAERLLYDHELNRLLGDIVARTRSVTCVLDCCHSAGVTRELAPDMTSRVLDLRAEFGLTEPIRGDEGDEGDEVRGDGLARGIDDCHVVSACLSHELARECVGEDGKIHGLLTRAFVRSLAEIPDGDLASVPWRRIWQGMRREVEGRNPSQHIWMAGNAGRAVLAGRPVDGDPGFSLRRVGDDYEIEAGTLASVTESAAIAVYGEQPRQFPPVDSEEDRAARLGLVRVTSAKRASAIATAEGKLFAIPSGARGRIVAPGKAARLRCAIVPPTPRIAAAVARSPLLELVEPAQAQVRLVQAGDRWSLTDDVHGADLGIELCALAAHQLDRVRDVLEHYFSYALPLRMAEAAIDLPGALRLLVLSCPGKLPPEVAETADLAEARTTAGSSAYEVTEDAGVCFRVHNTSSVQLRVTLVNSAASGKVQILDEQSIDPRSTHTFWAGNQIGTPFRMTLPRGKRQAIDRLIAIGTTANQDLRYLGIDRSFAEVLASALKDIGGPKKPSPPVEQWTATQVIVKTHAHVP